MKKAIIITETAPVLTKSDESASLSDEALHGMVVNVIEEADDFIYAEMPYRYNGFIHRSNLSFDERNTARTADCVTTGRIADILDRPKIQGLILASLPYGSAVKRLGGDEDGFSEIMLADGRTGYIRSAFLSPKAPEFDYRNSSPEDEYEFRLALIKTAQAYLNAPYRWGGKTMQGIDCSGLCSMAYLLNGVVIYRDAAIKQAFPIKPISANCLKPGDLIFFPGHVAMYVNSSRFIHSSLSNNGVYYNSLDEGDALYRRDLAETITAYGSIF